ncbi:PAS domain S-box protein [Methylocapsa palsarum]|uniref:PAS domain S-box protein n=1 Tax=Methylocapsa palsarum TaxID=1612308 RepID=UPI001587F48F|nr:PAS domain S-box protein [Methylocapsa palsarum]
MINRSSGAGSPEVPEFLRHGGEMGARIGASDWSGSSLGPVSQWPAALKNALGLVLPSEAQIVLFWGPDYVAFYNDAYAPSIGDKHPRALGRPAAESWTELWDDLEPMLSQVRTTGKTVFAKDRPFDIERRGYREKVSFDISYSALRDETGGIGGVLCIVSETTERVLAERRVAFRSELWDRLRASSDPREGIATAAAMLGRHLDASCAGYAEFDAESGLAIVADDWSAPGFASIAGVHRLDDFGSGLADELRAGRTAVIFDAATHPLTGGAAVAYALIRTRALICAPVVRDGVLAGLMFVLNERSRRWTEGDVLLVKEVAERTFASAERARAESRLRESEARFRNLADSAQVMVWMTAADGACTYLSRSWYEFTGQTPETGLGFGWLDAIHPDDAAEAARDAVEANSKHEPINLEYRLRVADGQYRWVIDVSAPRFGPDGAFLGYVGSVMDISERKRTEADLAISEQRFRAAVDAVQGILWTNDASGRMRGEQPGWAALTGQTFDEYQSLGWSNAIHPDDVRPTVEAWNAAVAGCRTFIFEHRVRRHDGEWRRFSVRAVPALVGEEGSVREWVGVHTDVTEQRAAESALLDLSMTLEERVQAATAERESALAQLHEMQKLDMIGQMTSAVAHDFNNLLTPIVGGLDIIREKIEGDARAQRLVAGAQQAAERATTLISRLLTFARRQHLEPRAVDLAGLVAGIEDLISRSVGPGVRLELELAQDLPAVRVDANQLELAILNLAVNARDAMSGEGVLTIRVDKPDERAPDRPPHLEPGAYERVRVIDTGCGMNGETLKRAVEPFYSTKDIGKGTGLGLSMVHGLAAQSSGALAIQSEPGRGTQIALWLPLASDADAGRLDESDEPVVLARRMSILLVDDDELVRTGTMEMLIEMGHEVCAAESGAQALELLSRDSGIDALLTDYLMPAMTGAELAVKARAIRPSLPVLLITGYADLAQGVGLGLPRLAKPFRQTQLASAIVSAIQNAIGS